MPRTGILLICLLTTAAAFSQSNVVDLYIGAKDREVRLLWIPTRWDPGFDGFMIKRRALGEWQPLSELVAPSKEAQDYFLTRSGGVERLRRELLRDPPYAHKSGFAYIDRTIPKTPADTYEYGIFLVENGQAQSTPAATATWQPSQHVDLDVGLEAADNLWDDKGVEVFFKVDERKFMEKAVGFRLIEHRGKNDRDAFGLARPIKEESGWSYVCRDYKAPYPDAVTLIIEDNFGFQVSATSKISASAKKTPRASVSPRDCWGPVMVQTGVVRPLREPRPMQ